MYFRNCKIKRFILISNIITVTVRYISVTYYTAHVHKAQVQPCKTGYVLLGCWGEVFSCWYSSRFRWISGRKMYTPLTTPITTATTTWFTGRVRRTIESVFPDYMHTDVGVAVGAEGLHTPPPVRRSVQGAGTAAARLASAADPAATAVACATGCPGRLSRTEAGCAAVWGPHWQVCSILH